MSLKCYFTKLSPSLNAKVDNIDDYLMGLVPTLNYSSIQYQKIELDFSIKLTVPQEDHAANDVGNYAVLEQDGKKYYLFIVGATWLSKDAVKIDFSIDSINTFADEFTFSKKTNIIRSHRDRFDNISTLTNGVNELCSKVDKINEGIQGVQYKGTRTVITDKRAGSASNQLWYLVYKSKQNPSANDAIDIGVYPQEPIKLATMASTIIFTAGSFIDGSYYYVMRNENPSLQYSGATWSTNAVGLLLYKDGNNIKAAEILKDYPSAGDIHFGPEGTNASATLGNLLVMRVGSVKTCNTYDISNYATRTIAKDGFLMSASITSVDRTLSSIVKIIELPYAPFEVNYVGDNLQLPYGWSIDADLSIKVPSNNVVGLTNNLDDVHDLELNRFVTISNNDFYINRTVVDPKLLNSSFTTYKLTYDSFSKAIAFEQLDRTTFVNPSYTIQYKQAETLTSNLGFKIELSKANFNATEDYPEYLLANRNNETPIYTNSYLNYLRTGYNYDVKAKQRNNVQTWVSAGTSLLSAAVSIASAIGSGGITAVAAASITANALATTYNAINNTINNERTLQAKITELQAQGTSVSGSDDIDMLNWYNGNKLTICTYNISPELTKLVDDLFYYTGYATNKQDIPDVTSRVWFNYIKCEPVFNEEQTTVYQKYLADIKARYTAGVTVFHKVNGTWDLDQVKENWEVGFVNA